MTTQEAQTIYQAVIRSPQWQGWLVRNEMNPQFDVHETMECDMMSDKHFQAFLKFCKEM